MKTLMSTAAIEVNLRTGILLLRMRLFADFPQFSMEILDAYFSISVFEIII